MLINFIIWLLFFQGSDVWNESHNLSYFIERKIMIILKRLQGSLIPCFIFVPLTFNFFVECLEMKRDEQKCGTMSEMWWKNNFTLQCLLTRLRFYLENNFRQFFVGATFSEGRKLIKILKINILTDIFPWRFLKTHLFSFRNILDSQFKEVD